jgi:hypothetical protein
MHIHNRSVDLPTYSLTCRVAADETIDSTSSCDSNNYCLYHITLSLPVLPRVVPLPQPEQRLAPVTEAWLYPFDLRPKDLRRGDHERQEGQRQLRHLLQPVARARRRVVEA